MIWVKAVAHNACLFFKKERRDVGVARSSNCGSDAAFFLRSVRCFYLSESSNDNDLTICHGEVITDLKQHLSIFDV